MSTPINIALTKQSALLRKLSVISNNVANSNTTGFQKEMVITNPLIMKDGSKNKIAYPNDIATIRDTTNGPIAYTGRPLDAAISGNGYFKIKSPQGIRYTRSGNFQTDNNGMLVDANYYPVLSTNGDEITIEPGTRVKITENGAVMVNDEPIALIGVFKFDNENLLINVGQNLYKADGGETLATNYKIISESLESSNVQSVIEMQELIETQRYTEMETNMINIMEELEKNAQRVLTDSAK
jgi:flagellar basal-body rod protein FlgF